MTSKLHRRLALLAAPLALAAALTVTAPHDTGSTGSTGSTGTVNAGGGGGSKPGNWGWE